MNPINLTKDYEFNPYDLQNVIEKVDLTLEDLFDIVNTGEQSIPGLADTLGMPNFSHFYNEIKKPYDRKKDECKLTHLYLRWSHDYAWKEIDGKWQEVKDEIEISSHMDISGVGKHYNDYPDPKDCRSSCQEHNLYGISFTSLNELAYLPIKIDPLIEHEGLKIKIDPTFYQLINSIFWDLTFYGGSPEERDKKGEHVSNLAKEAKDELRLIKEGDNLIKRAFEDETKK